MPDLTGLDNTGTPLTPHDLSEILANVNLLEGDTMCHLEEYIKSDPRLQPAIAELERLLRDVYPKSSMPSYLPGAMHCLRDLETLLARDDWQHPREVLDPEDPKRCIEYSGMIRLAAARARRAQDPQPFLEVKRKLEAAHVILDDLENRLRGLDARIIEGIFCEVEDRLLEIRGRLRWKTQPRKK